MAIYTSNYARKGSDPGAIAISRKAPDWFEGRVMTRFAPTWEMIFGVRKGHLTHEQYTKQYLQILYAHPFDLMQFLDSLPDPTYFLCYEAPGEFCHRHIFAEWVEYTCGWVIPEWKNPKEIEEDRQASMVDDLCVF